jgi:hypothetical protein
VHEVHPRATDPPRDVGPHLVRQVVHVDQDVVDDPACP